MRISKALALCDALGWHRGGCHESWRTYVRAVSFAPAGDTQFTYELITRRRDDDPGDEVVGWWGPHPFQRLRSGGWNCSFGRDSPLVSLAKDPTRAHCAECEEFAPSGTCGHCGAVREDDE